MCPIHHRPKKDKRTQERLRFSTSRLKIYLWENHTDEKPISGFCFVSDLSATGAGLFVDRKILSGKTCRLSLESVNGATFKGMVMWSNRFSFRQQFLGHEALSFRMGLRFLFASEAERQRYLKYLDGIRQKVLVVEPGMKF